LDFSQINLQMVNSHKFLGTLSFWIFPKMLGRPPEDEPAKGAGRFRLQAVSIETKRRIAISPSIRRRVDWLNEDRPLPKKVVFQQAEDGRVLCFEAPSPLSTRADEMALAKSGAEAASAAETFSFGGVHEDEEIGVRIQVSENALAHVFGTLPRAGSLVWIWAHPKRLELWHNTYRLARLQRHIRVVSEATDDLGPDFND
jgi:hypothetical protein